MTPPRWPGSTDGVGTIIACGVGVAVGGTAVGGTAVAGTRVAGTRVAVGAGVEVDSIIAGGVGVTVGGTAVGGTRVAVGAGVEVGSAPPHAATTNARVTAPMTSGTMGRNRSFATRCLPYLTTTPH